MKALAFIALSLISLNSFSATLKKIDRFQDGKLNEISASHKTLLGIVGNCGFEAGYEIVAKNPNEKLTTTASQLIYRTNTEYSTPDSVELDVTTEISKAIREATYSVENRDGYNLNSRQLENLVTFKSLMNQIDIAKTEIVTAQHGNSFGDSTAAILFKGNEVLVMQMGYCE